MNDLLNTLADIIEVEYLFADKAPALAEQVRQQGMPSGTESHIAESITQSLVELSNDEHFLLEYAPYAMRNLTDHETIMKAHTDASRARNFGFETVRYLPGRIGYWKLNELPPAFISGRLIQACITLTENAEQLILDLQDCEGGVPDTVALLGGIFLIPGLALSGFESRKHGKREVYTPEQIDGQRLPDMPLSILIGERTFSAAEALAYDLQAHKRATIIGKTSRGGAHLSDFFPVDGTWRFRVPVARAYNPITQGNWEGTGVVPDIQTDTPLETALELTRQSR